MASQSEKPYLGSNSPSAQASTPDEKIRPGNSVEPADDDMERRLTRAHTIDKQIKHRVRILRVINRFGSAIASVLVLGVMVNTYLTFTTHKTTGSASNGTFIQVYPKKPLLWPTYMMLATATISLFFDLAVLAAYCISMASRAVVDKVGKANVVDNYHSKVGYVISATNFVVWLATSTTFKMVQGAPDANPPPNDLFGFSCSNAADALQAKIGSFVNFDTQCKTQRAGFAVSVLNAALGFFALVINIIAVRRWIHKKKMTRLESRANSAGVGGKL